MSTTPAGASRVAVQAPVVHRGPGPRPLVPAGPLAAVFFTPAQSYPALGDQTHASLDCITCTRYRVARAHVLPAAVYRYAGRRRMHPSDLFHTFMTGVHARHLAGLPLGTE